MWGDFYVGGEVSFADDRILPRQGVPAECSPRCSSQACTAVLASQTARAEGALGLAPFCKLPASSHECASLALEPVGPEQHFLQGVSLKPLEGKEPSALEIRCHHLPDSFRPLSWSVSDFPPVGLGAGLP